MHLDRLCFGGESPNPNFVVDLGEVDLSDREPLVLGFLGGIQPSAGTLAAASGILHWLTHRAAVPACESAGKEAEWVTLL